MRAMQGWVIERAPFRGNGFAPGESGEVIAEFKVDSVRLPHGAQMWRMRRDSGETLVAMLDSDGPRWRPGGPEGEGRRCATATWPGGGGGGTRGGPAAAGRGRTPPSGTTASTRS